LEKLVRTTKRTGAVVALAAVIASALIGTQGAPALAASGHNWVQTTVPVGATYRTQYLFHTGHGSGTCYSTQGMYVSWTMDVRTDGIYVSSIKLEMYNNSYDNDLVIGAKWIYGSTSGPTKNIGIYNYVPTRDVVYPWVKTYYINQFFPWRQSVYVVGFYFALLLPCYVDGWETMAFELKKG
jgi:hypothetical protein